MLNLNRSKRQATCARRETRGVAVRTLQAFALSAIAASICGCQALNVSKPTDDEYRSLTNTDHILGPMARAIQTSLQGDVANSVASPELQRQIASANQLFESGKYGEAAQALKRIAVNNKQTAFGEEAQFKLAESFYRQKRYAQAQNEYERLLAEYPATRHVDNSSQRLFSIARAWLGVPAPKTAMSGIQLASHEEGGELQEPAKLNTDDITVKIPLLPNFHDPTRPTFDTRGRALKALKSIWMNDPNSPLADDALMMTAMHYLQKGNHVEADRYFEMLREDSKTPHLKNAFLLGSHVKLLSYQGPAYESNSLDQARALKESTLRLFPDLKQRDQLRQELQDIYDAKAQKLWFNIGYWQSKGEPRAVALECQRLIEEFPDTEWAQRARRILDGIDKKALQGLPGF